MKKIQLLIASSILLLFSTVLQAQRVFELMETAGVNLEEVQKEAAKYFATIEDNEDKGYLRFKRWEYHALTNLQANGTVLNNEDHAAVIKSSKKKGSTTAGKAISTSDWTALGPFAMTRTSQSYLPGAGRISAIYVEPVEQKIIYAGAPGGGLWKSSNAGNSWTPLGDQFENMYIYAIEGDPTNSDVVYVGNSQGQLQKSTDGGLNFDILLDESGILRTILIHPNDPNDIYVALEGNGLYHSTNGGDAWTRVIAADIEDVCYKPGSTTTVYACGDDFYRSTDSGTSFNQITNGIEASYRMKLAVSPANEDYVYIIQRGDSGFGYLYRSTDSGTSFTVQTDASAGDFVGFQSYSDMVVAVSDTNVDEVHIGGFELYKSTDGGVSFIQETLGYVSNSLPYVHANIEVMHYIDGTIYVASDGGIYKSTDAGTSFTDLSTGLGIQQFYRIANATSNKDVIIGGAQNTGSSIRAGSTAWTNFLSGDGTDCMVDTDNENVIYGSRQNGVLTTSTDGGTNIKYLRPPENGQGVWVTPFGMDPNNSSTIYAGYADLYRHDNGGLTAFGDVAESEDWINVSTNITFDSKLYHLEVCPSTSEVIYVATLTSLYKSTDITSSSPTWTRLTPPITDGLFINDIAVDPYDENRIAVITTSGFVVLSIDGGANWTRIDEGLPDTSLKTMVFDRSPDQGMYLGINGMVFYKSNKVTNWTIFSNNLPNVVISELELYYDHEVQENSRIRVATYGRGLWESPLYDDRKQCINSCIDGFNTPYTTIEAENFCEQVGVEIETDSKAIGYIENGDYIKFNNVAFGGNGAASFEAIVASDELGGTIEIRLNNPITGPLVGTCDVSNTGSWEAWVNVTCDINGAIGTHDTYLVFTGGDGFLFNMDSFAFTEIDICTEGADAYTTMEAENYCDQRGVEIELDGKSIGFIENGNYIKFNSVAFGTIKTATFEAKVASPTSGGTIEIRLDDLAGELVGSCAVDNTGSWNDWVKVSTEVKDVVGTHDLYLVFSGGSGFLFNMDWFHFTAPVLNSELSTPTLESATSQVSLFPNPARTTIHLQLPRSKEKTEVIISNILGQVISTNTFATYEDLNLIKMNVTGLSQGLYHVNIRNGKTRFIKSMVVEK